MAASVLTLSALELLGKPWRGALSACRPRRAPGRGCRGRAPGARVALLGLL